MAQKRRIVVTGMGVVSCFGTDVDHYYQQLLEGKSGVGFIDQFPCSDWPTHIAAGIKDFDPGDYMDKKQARRVDPYVRYAMVAGKKALEYAKIDQEVLATFDKTRCGVIVGSGMGGMQVFHDGVETLLTKGYKRLTPFFVPYIITNMAGALLAIDLGFMGPNYSISTACATSNHSIQSAAEQILLGNADLMLCGGAEAAVLPIGLAGFTAIKALSTCNDAPEKASKPWDRRRDGFVMGEGAGVLVLEELEHALKRGAPIFAEYLGGAANCDGYHMTDPRPDGLGVALCIEKALASGNIPKERVNYINAHATSTPVGDLCEIEAILKVFGKQASQIKINATKSMIGHCLGAAGGLEAVATVQAIRTQMLHPTINLEDPEPLLGELDPVALVKKAHSVDVAISNSFGFGGHNAALAFGRFSS